MADLESLNDRQRAVLQLLLLKGKSYDDLAGMLKMDAAGVRSRARGAIAAISPDADQIGNDRRDEIADYLLGQQTAPQRAATREYLDGSHPARAWARAAATALRPIGGTLPEVPAEPAAEAAGASARPNEAPAETNKRSSQLGTRLVFAGLGVVIAIAIIVAMSLGGGDDGGKASTTTGAAQTTPTGDKFEVVAQGSLQAPDGAGSNAKGNVAIVRFPSNGQYRFALEASGLQPGSSRGSAYGVWLFTSQNRKRFLGFPDMTVGKDGKLQTVSDLAPNTPIYGAVLLTRETAERPKRPGTIVLAARLITAADVQRQQQQQRGGTQTQTTP